jgi:hypothetical protein
MVFPDFPDKGLCMIGGFRGLDGEFVVGQRKPHRIPLADFDLPGKSGRDTQSQAVPPFL